MSREVINVVSVLTDDYVSHIEGKLLTLLEGMGLPQNQEKAVKSLVRELLWNEVMDFALPVQEEEFAKFKNIQVHGKKKNTLAEFRLFSEVSGEEIHEALIQFLDTLGISGSVLDCYDLYVAIDKEHEKAIKTKS